MMTIMRQKQDKTEAQFSLLEDQPLNQSSSIEPAS